MRSSFLRKAFFSVSLLGLVAASPVFERDALACGGGFFENHVPGEVIPGSTEAVEVTDHRMVVVMERTKTVLYDQILFHGNPKGMAWVLPVKGEAKLGLSTDKLFEALDRELGLKVVGPTVRCPSCTSISGGGGGGGGGVGCGSASASDSFSGASSKSAGPNDGAGEPERPEPELPVTVKSHEAVGPYEVVRVAGEDPKAMAEWLSKNGYKVPASFEPVLAAYVREKFDFLALRLRPGQSASAIRPVRVELQGGSNVVPMRASAAGPTDKLGITMYVVSESQAFVPSSYPVFTVPSASITWDFAKKKSDYAEVREARAAESGYRAWELVGAETKSGIGMRITVDGKYEGETAEADRQADVEAFGVAPRMITHLRANVRTSELTSDVVLEPVNTAPTLTRSPSKVSGAPMCKTFDADCNVTGEAPASGAQIQPGPATGASRTPSAVAMGGLVTALVALFRPRKRRP
ncbi:MAG: DUF2330 domain-containing protein [Myxococcales bacterium]|nr:DUF2330 domain-containing protein [Myxococcales bacterium]